MSKLERMQHVREALTKEWDPDDPGAAHEVIDLLRNEDYATWYALYEIMEQAGATGIDLDHPMCIALMRVVIGTDPQGVPDDLRIVTHLWSHPLCMLPDYPDWAHQIGKETQDEVQRLHKENPLEFDPVIDEVARNILASKMVGGWSAVYSAMKNGTSGKREDAQQKETCEFLWRVAGRLNTLSADEYSLRFAMFALFFPGCKEGLPDTLSEDLTCDPVEETDEQAQEGELSEAAQEQACREEQEAMLYKLAELDNDAQRDEEMARQLGAKDRSQLIKTEQDTTPEELRSMLIQLKRQGAPIEQICPGVKDPIRTPEKCPPQKMTTYSVRGKE